MEDFARGPEVHEKPPEATPGGWNNICVVAFGGNKEEVLSLARLAFLKQLGDHKNVAFRCVPSFNSERRFDREDIIYNASVRGWSW